MYLLPIVKKGASMGKKIVRKEKTQFIIVFVGRNLKKSPVALVYIPKRLKTIDAILPASVSKSLGMFFIIFFPLFFILSHKVRG